MLAAVLAASAPVTFPQLQAALGQASRTTTFRYLRHVRHVRSYNHNGRYYTHRDPVRFDRHGLFSLGDVHFSRDRSLSATVQRLVREAEAGRTQKELQALLHVSVHAFLLAGFRQQALQRERLGGVWVYLAGDPAVGDAQRRERRQRLARRRAGEAAAALEATVVIEVLLVLIRHPGTSPLQVARRLQGHAPPIGLPQVSAVFTRYDLEQLQKRGASTDC